MANTSAWPLEIRPEATARWAVRAIRASIPRSIRQLRTKPDAASKPMPALPAASNVHGTIPSVARNMPMTAQNTASNVTRGLVNETRSRATSVKRAAVGEIAGVIG